MSKYTTELRFICETYAGLEESEGYDKIDEIVANSRTKIFDFSYPIFDEAYRPILETKIIEHYYTREICAETVGRWKLFLKAKMNEIMPYYNKLYESELLMADINPLRDVDYTREGERQGNRASTTVGNGKRVSTDSGHDTTTGRSTGTVTDSGESERNRESRDKYSEWNLYSDTPQSGIAGISGAEDDPSLGDNGYLTNARHILHDGEGTTDNETTNSETTRTNNLTDTSQTDYGRVNNTTDDNTQKMTGTEDGEYTERVHGLMGGRSISKLLQEYRDTLLNIDMEVIRQLEPLFLQLW